MYPLLLLLALTLLAAFLRLFHLGSLPVGLHHDEASNGMLALDILHGAFPVFFSDYTGKEAGFMYLVALSITLFGQTIFAVRLPAALAGVALVPAVFLLGRRALGSTWGGLLAAGMTAVAPWLLHINRIGFRASLLSLLLTVWAWLLLRGLQQNMGRDWLGAGVLLGLTAYTYTSARIVPLLVLLFIGYLLLWHRQLLLRCWRGLAGMLLLATLLATPLLLHFFHHPEDWSERLEQIGACPALSSTQCVAQVASHAWATLAMVGVRGDPLGFFNLPYAPALPLVAGWLFYIGLGLAVWRSREPAMALLLLWWLVLVVPGILSRDSPHFLRTIGAAPPTMLLWALPFGKGEGRREKGEGQTVPKSARFPFSAARFAPIVGGIVLVLATWASWQQYFVQWAARPAGYYDFMGYASDAALAIAQEPPEREVFISEEYYRHPTYLYLAPRTTQAGWFDARYGLPLPRSSEQSRYYISPATPTDSRTQPFVSGAGGNNVLNAHGQYAYTLLEMEKPDPVAIAPQQALTVTIDAAVFEGLTVEEPQEHTLPVTLFWRVQHATQANLRVFVHLVDAQGAMLGQHDTISYPSQEWQADDRFITFHTIPRPAEILPEQVFLRIGLYDSETFARVPIAQPAHLPPGVVIADDAMVVPVGRVWGLVSAVCGLRSAVCGLGYDSSNPLNPEP